MYKFYKYFILVELFLIRQNNQSKMFTSVTKSLEFPFEIFVCQLFLRFDLHFEPRIYGWRFHMFQRVFCQ